MLQTTCLAINTWPPPYQIRFSRKAKYIQFKITSAAGLEIVIPYLKTRVNIPALLAEKRSWLEQHLAHSQQAVPAKATTEQLPKILPLNAIAEIWQISYVETKTKSIKLLEQPGYHLTCYGRLNASVIQTRLINWLKKYAAQKFAGKLASLSHKTAITYKKLAVRGQKTLWGSCSAQHNISLNFKLLFLPASSFNYVLLHELCHIKHLNHANKFWQLLTEYDSNALAHDQALKHGDQYVPQWVLNFAKNNS